MADSDTTHPAKFTEQVHMSNAAPPPDAPRILLISPQPYFQWRGSPIRVGFNVQALAELGYSVDLLAMPVGEDRDTPGVTLYRAPNIIRAKNLSIGPSLKKAILDVSILWKASRLIRRKSYAVIHGIEDAGPIAAYLAKRHRLPMVFEKHSDPASYKKGFIRRCVLGLYKKVEAYAIRNADAIIGTGPALVTQAQRIAPGKPVHHIFDIPSSLVEPDPERTAQERAKYAPHSADVIALYVGSFASYQGIPLMIQAIPKALQKAPNLRVVIIGGTDEEIARLKQDLTLLGCEDRVYFPGKIHPDQLPHTLAAADILLSPRIAGDNTPLKLLDYAKAGGAIVACDNPANRLILNDEQAMLATPTPDAFAGKIAELALDKSLRDTIAAAGHRLYTETYNYQNFKSRLGDCYSRLPSAK